MNRTDAFGYSDFDRERFLAETRSGPTTRTEFARDRARVLHSSALRRLGAKTQVLSPSGGDFARTRLTHSLEVAQIGREMATDLGVDPDLVDMACLAHDLGHPPFGHNGEKALNEWAREFGGFEGNAQTLRLIARIEPKVFTIDGTSRGLNLTRASLDATCKYPWSRAEAQVEAGGDRSTKFGYYDDDAEVFNWMRAGSISGQKSVEAQIMDFADDVAYSVHDFEDAIVSGYVDPSALADLATLSDLVAKISDWNGGEIAAANLESAFARLAGHQYWPESFDGSPQALGELKNLTSALIGSFVRRVTESTQTAFPNAAALTRFEASLRLPDDVAAEIAVLKGIVSAFLMSHESRKHFYEWQRALLTELADALLATNGKHLDSYSASAWATAASDSQKHRVVVDQVACLTDQSAISLHHLLVGSKR